MNELLTTVLDYQRKHNLTDEQFAKLLDISSSYWSLIKNEHRPIRYRFIMAVSLNIKELRVAVAQHMSQGGDAKVDVAQ